MLELVMKSNKVIWFHLLVFLVLLVFGLPQIFNLSVFRGFYYGDSEVMAFIAYILGKGGKFYQDFSIVYGPGRFVVLSYLNKIFGVEISLPLLISYTNLISRVLIPWSIYWVVYKLINLNNKLINFILAFGAALVYLIFLRSGQDIHLIILLFVGCFAEYQKNHKKIWAIFSGFLLGLIGFFRIESGVFAIIVVFLVEFLYKRKEINKKYFWTSYLFFQIGYFLLITLYGSLPNFFHDVVYLGVISQPKIMKILIQSVDFPLFEFFLLSNVFGVLMALYSKHKSFLLLSGLSLLGYANALGRADFDHLYYGIVLAVPTMFVSMTYLIKNWKQIKLEKIDLKMIIFVFIILFLELIIIKKQLSFLLLGLLLVLVLGYKLIKKNIGLVSIFILLVSCHTLVRSSSLFMFYLKRQMQLPQRILLNEIPKNIINFMAELKMGNYGGYQLDDKNSKALLEIKKEINTKSVFVYPSHATIYQALAVNQPTRYLYFNNEYTNKMETETIEILTNKQIEFVLLSYELTKVDAIVPNQTKIIENFIYQNYEKVKEYDFGNDNFILMKKIIR